MTQTYNPGDAIDIDSITDPLVSYELYCSIMPEFRDLKSYVNMVSIAYLSKMIIEQSVETKISIIEKWIKSFDKNSWLVQAYADRILSNPDRFEIIISPIGFIDYIDVDENGDVTVNTLLNDELKGMNNYGLFNTLFEKGNNIPLLIRDKSLIKETTFPDEKNTLGCKLYDIFSMRIRRINSHINNSKFSPSMSGVNEVLRLKNDSINSDKKSEESDDAPLGKALGIGIFVVIALQIILPLFLHYFMK